MTLRKYNDKKRVSSEELSSVTGGINVDYGYCEGCVEITPLSILVRNNGYCDKCAHKSGGATGSW